MMDAMGLILILSFAGIAIYLSQGMIGNGVYIMTKHWRESLFLLFCALAGAGFAVSLRNDVVGIGDSGLKIPRIEFFSADIASDATMVDVCKQFVEAHSGGQAFTPPALSGLVSLNEDNYWELCARTFGMNYWKYDITVNGRNGGLALCDAAGREGRDSSTVRTWCSTVFSSVTPSSGS